MRRRRTCTCVAFARRPRTLASLYLQFGCPELGHFAGLNWPLFAAPPTTRDNSCLSSVRRVSFDSVSFFFMTAPLWTVWSNRRARFASGSPSHGNIITPTLLAHTPIDVDPANTSSPFAGQVIVPLTILRTLLRLLRDWRSNPSKKDAPNVVDFGDGPETSYSQAVGNSPWPLISSCRHERRRPGWRRYEWQSTARRVPRWRCKAGRPTWPRAASWKTFTPGRQAERQNTSNPQEGRHVGLEPYKSHGQAGIAINTP